MKKWTFCAAAIAAIAATPNVWCANDAEKIGWSGEVGLTYIEKSGNSNNTSFNGKSKAIREGEIWRNTFKLEGANESAEEVRATENYFASAKLDYKLDEDAYLFALEEYTDDRFSGFDYESSTTFGYGRELFDNGKHKLSGDVGSGYRRSKLIEASTIEEEAIVRLAALYRWTISETTVFEEDANSEFGEDKTVSKSLSRLKFKINGSLWATIAYEIKHTSNAPFDDPSPDEVVDVEEVENSDRTTSVGLNYSF